MAKKYTKEDIEKIKPYHGDLPAECWKILEENKDELDAIVIEEDERSLDEVLQEFEEAV